ncbi:MAG: hypothetical protein ACFFAN_09375 [Promethearchaeota archaeon]
MIVRYQIADNLWWFEHQSKIYIFLPCEKINEIYILKTSLEKKLWKFINNKSIEDIISQLEDFASKKEILTKFNELLDLKLLKQVREIRRPHYYLKRSIILLSEACNEKCSWCPYWKSQHYMEKNILNKLILKILSKAAMANHIAIWGGDNFSENSLVEYFLEKLQDWNKKYITSAFWITIKIKKNVKPTELAFLLKFKDNRMKITIAIETNIEDFKDINESKLKLNRLKRMGLNVIYHAWINSFALKNPDIFKELNEIIIFERPSYLISVHDYSKFLLKICKHKKMYLFMNDALSRCLTIDQSFHSNCGAGRDMIFINSFGNLFQCYGAYRLGKDVGKLWLKKFSSILKKRSLPKKCIACGIHSICKGCLYPPTKYKEDFCIILKKIVYVNAKPLIDFINKKELLNKS